LALVERLYLGMRMVMRWWRAVKSWRVLLLLLPFCIFVRPKFNFLCQSIATDQAAAVLTATGGLWSARWPAAECGATGLAERFDKTNFFVCISVCFADVSRRFNSLAHASICLLDIGHARKSTVKPALVKQEAIGRFD